MDKYRLAEINIDLIKEKFSSLNDYDEAVNAYLSDSFFYELKHYLDDENFSNFSSFHNLSISSL